jgi:Uma2 family endonuclease
MNMETTTAQAVKDGPALTPWRISSDRYLQMIRDGVFGEEDRVELINGMIVEMTPPSPEHDHNVVRFLSHLRPPPDVADLGPNIVIEIGEGQIFQPDFVLLKPGRINKTHYPKADDVLLIAETAKTSLAKDRGPKLRAYASAGVADYWVADVEQQRLFVHRDPVEDGYAKILELAGSDTVAPLLLPEVDGATVRVGDLFS